MGDNGPLRKSTVTRWKVRVTGLYNFTAFNSGQAAKLILPIAWGPLFLICKNKKN